MNRTKKIFSVVLALVCVLSCMLNTTLASEVQPRYSTLSTAKISLEINSLGKSTCSSTVVARSTDYSIEIDMILYRVNGGTLTEVKSWNYSASPKVEYSVNYYVPTGRDYLLVCDVQVTNGAGVLLESTTLYSDVCSC